jgi:epoxyqueuosine reductase
MKQRLKRLTHRIQAAYPSARTRWYVDTGPVLERELAARAGLGAFGKNTNLLHPERGSWFLLGELFLTLTVAADPPLADLCGSCSACLEACPTGALPEPYRLDSRRCISYWTIEHRGAIPPDRRASLAGWVFGCDVCQEVCPLNAEVAPADHPELELPAERAGLDLKVLLALEREEYGETFRASPMKRAQLQGLRRNAAVAMGNSRQRRYVPVLIEVLSDGDPVVRGHAAWALGLIGGDKARSALAAASARESEPAIRAEIESALAAIRAPAQGPA